MNFQQNIMPSNSIVLALASLLSADATTFQSLLSCDRTKSLTVQKNPCVINPTDHIQNILTSTQMKNWNGSRIITDVILIYLSVNYTTNSALPKAIPNIPDHCTAFIGSLVIPVQLLQPRPDADLRLMTPNPAWNQMADGCQICSDSLLFRLRTAKVLPVYGNWRSLQRTFHLPLSGAKQLFNCGFFLTCHSLFWVLAWYTSDWQWCGVYTCSGNQTCTSTRYFVWTAETQP